MIGDSSCAFRMTELPAPIACTVAPPEIVADVWFAIVFRLSPSTASW